MLFPQSNLKNNFFVTALLIIGIATASAGCKGKMGQKTEQPAAPAATSQQNLQAGAKGVSQGESDSDLIPIADSYVKGSTNGPITITEFSDFQCPFCKRGHDTVEEVLAKYPGKIRLVFKNYPLPFHGQALDAAIAALAAGEQGKFWEMYSKLFDNQKEFGSHASDMKAWTAGLAKDLGLDTNKFNADFDKLKANNNIKDDQALGNKIGVNGTPAFFINGKFLSGAQPIEEFQKIIDQELKDIQAAGDKLPANSLYSERVKTNFVPPKPPEAQKPKTLVKMVPVTKDDFAKDNTKDPLVTIVEFSDFQCPFCSRVNPTIEQLEKNFGKQIRLVYKQNPLPFHPYAEPAARAAVAAGKQGKFWEMHDKLFENQQQLGTPDFFEKTAKEIGLNVGKFKKDFDSDETKQKVKDDLALGSEVGARGTPNFFINGVQLVGAQPYPAFEDLVKKQLDIAKKIADDKKLAGNDLYEAVVKYNIDQASSDAANDAPPQPSTIPAEKLAQGNAYAKGPKDATVTITEFSDFQCPFCKRGHDTLDDVLKKYEGKIRVVFKNFPLGFHQNAEPAARAALAAGKQGKFWEMYDKLFANQAQLGSPDFLQNTAKELGLNLDKFNSDFNSDEIKKQVQDDIKQGQSVGVNGTPAFFINGQPLIGAQPLEAFSAIIDPIVNKK